MKTHPLIVERVYTAPVEKVWTALTDKDQMKQWYFELQEFKPLPGFEFRFFGGKKEKQYLHICEVMEVVPLEKLSYSWRYDGYSGNSIVSFELFKEDETHTRLKLKHDGLNSFPSDEPDLAASNFAEGWNFILGESLTNFVEIRR
jgi:uncharacterized protein YndB with AHSA1/START domain